MLGEYLKSEASRRWQDGVVDCTMFAADWAATWGLGDPAAKWRGLYSTDEEARCLIARAGGLLNLFQQGLASIGIDGVNDPIEGDVGVIRAVGMDRREEHIGAIWTGRRWAFRVEDGLAFASAEFLRCWGPR